jgi:hypothetical protein
VEGLEVATTIAGGQARRQAGDNRKLLVVGHVAVAAQNPDQAAVTIARA